MRIPVVLHGAFTFGIVVLFYVSIGGGHEVEFRCSFDFYFPGDK